MSKALTLTAEARTDLGKKSNKALRVAGKIPAVLYGHGEANANLALDLKEFSRAFMAGSRLFELKTGKSAETAMLVDVQWDALGDNVIHADFSRISLDERVEVNVHLVFKGTPAGVKSGGMIEQQHITLHVECPAADIPEHITVDISGLELEDSLRVGDIQVPAGVTVIDHADVVVLHIAKPQEEVAAEAAEGDAPAGPEVLTERKDKEGEGEKAK